MLNATDQVSVQGSLVDYISSSGWLLIADEASNVDRLGEVIAAHAEEWIRA